MLPVLLQKEVEKLDVNLLFAKLQTSSSGLTKNEVIQRQSRYGKNILEKHKIKILQLVLRQFTSNPLLLILAVATVLSYLLGQHVSSYYIFIMIMASVVLGFFDEYSSEKIIEKLLKKISPMSEVLRQDEIVKVKISDITLGDIVLISAGSVIPADVRFIETKNLEVNESILTGESKAVFKTQEAGANIGSMGTTVISGWAKAVVFQIGKDTEYGKIAKHATFLKPSTEFQNGLAKFGNMILRIIIILTVIIFTINSLVGHPILDSLLFALAIAVGLTPELLPVIVTVSLAAGAGKLAKKHVIAKQLIAIEDLGNMDVLCTDKTGTLTEGKLEVIEVLDKKELEATFEYALLCNNAITHNGQISGDSIDVAIVEHAKKKKITRATGWTKIYMEPFDYNKRMMFCVVQKGNETRLVVKGATDALVPLCENDKSEIITKSKTLQDAGFRVILVASKKIEKKQTYNWSDIRNISCDGLVSFFDIPKKSAKDAIVQFADLHVDLKVITGDNDRVTRKVCEEIGIDPGIIVTGRMLDEVPENELSAYISKTKIFAKVNPLQKLKIIEQLKKMGHTVGYLGDGINDIPSLRGADVGISVNSAADVAKDAASIVLLRKNLHVIVEGIIEGRRTFANTIKYILMSSSSNFGNMFSASIASFFLPFLPMTPLQILLTNGLYDISQMSIPSDSVDKEELLKPRHFDISFIKRYMIFFGPLSSIYDILTFLIMTFGFHAKGALFQTGWFVESVATQILVIFVVRTSKSPFFLSRPSIYLFLTSITMVGIGLALPFSPLAHALGFVKLPMSYFGVLLFLIVTYVSLVELVKGIFLKRYTLK